MAYNRSDSHQIAALSLPRGRCKKGSRGRGNEELDLPITRGVQSLKASERRSKCLTRKIPKTLQGSGWKGVGSDLQKDPAAKRTVIKRIPKKIRQIPDYYFPARRSLPATLALYGAYMAGGIGAGMVMEIWINKKSERGRRHRMGV